MGKERVKRQRNKGFKSLKEMKVACLAPFSDEETEALGWAICDDMGSGGPAFSQVCPLQVSWSTVRKQQLFGAEDWWA